MGRDAGGFVEHQDRRIFVDNRRIYLAIRQGLRGEPLFRPVKKQHVTGAQSLAFLSDSSIDQEKLLADRLFEYLARNVRQTSARERVQADIRQMRWNLPRLYFITGDLIRHISYRTIPRNLMAKNCFSVIIAGGKGTRFWPLSRAQRPKQLLKILSRKSLIEETVERVTSLCGREHTLVVTISEQLAALRNELGQLPKNNFLAEPEGKNTAPCIGLAALEVTRSRPDAVMIVLPADHWVADVNKFRRTLKAATQLAVRTDQLVTIGIRPDYPETGYGYIVKGKAIKGESGAFVVKRFTEKPDHAAAGRLIRQGSLWNSGIFVWKAATLLELLARYQPKIARGLDAIRKQANGKSLANSDSTLRAAIIREYKKMPNISIDYAVLEKAGSEGKVLTLEGDFGWSDVGSWAAAHRMMRKDAQGNAGNGRWLGLASKNCLIHAPDRLVVLLGIENAVVVDTADALLVGDLRRSQEVRELVDELKRKGFGSLTIK
jgi:mannose-1-phosphate guanylyltransferase